MRAIRDKVIAVNDMVQAQYRANKKGISVNDLINNIANQFNFLAKLPAKNSNNSNIFIVFLTINYYSYYSNID